MPVAPTFPGVYIEEVPSSVRTISGVATSITAFLGRAPRGPVNDPVTITSFADFERGFGGLSADAPMTYAVRDFFLNGGSRAVVARLFRPPTGGGVAKATLGALKLEAANAGAWGNVLRTRIDHADITAEIAERFGLAQTDLFNLTITGGPPESATERIRNLSLKEGARRVDRVLARESQLVRVQRKADGTPDLPTATERPAETTGESPALAGGVDSQPLDQVTYLGARAQKTGLFALERTELFNLLCIPPDTRDGSTPAPVYQAALQYCVERRAMLIVDPPAAMGVANASAELNGLGLTGPSARNAALYFPRLLQSDPLRDGQLDTFVPCGAVAGVIARTDAQRGVWKAPAGLDAAVAGVQGLSIRLTDAENGLLNPRGVNCLRALPAAGTVVWGARTLRGADQLGDEYKYVPVRRLALFIEETLFRGTQFAVFEPNDEPLWSQIRLNVGAFMQTLFVQGAFQGRTPQEAYFVKCDKDTTTQQDINLGIVNILVGFAAVKPAEFVILKIQQIAGQVAA
jgi:phage tail sheath protein FI